MPDCAFEIWGTNRYTVTAHEAKIISRKHIGKGEEIKYLCGIRVILTSDEEDDLDRRGQGFSIVETTRNKAISFLFGPARFANHDCGANARLITTGSSGMNIIAVRDIEIGEELTVTYDDHYFGKNNCECLCKTCEDCCRNGWKPEHRIDFSGSPRPSLCRQSRHEWVESLDDLPTTPGARTSRSKSKRASRHTTSSRSNLTENSPKIDVNAQHQRAVPEHEKMMGVPTHHDLVRVIRVPGDYLTSSSHAGPAAWTHLDGCLKTESVRANGVPDSCIMCERHKKLYGYGWPKTKQKGRWDNEERAYSPGP